MTRDCEMNFRAALLGLLLVAALSAGVGAQTPPLWGSLESGPYAVGFTVMEKYDYSRAFSPKRDYYGEMMSGERARPIQICIWYPAVDDDTGPSMAYGEYVYTSPTDERFINFLSNVQNGNLGFIRGLAGRAGGAMEDYLNVEMGAVRDAARAEGTFPLVVYYAGQGGVGANATLCEYLASFGFVVAATHPVGPTGVDIPPEDVGVATLLADGAFVTAVMAQESYIDRDRMIAMGHGSGGVTAILAAMRNTDVDAVIGLGNLVPVELVKELFEASPYYGPERLRVPFFSISSQDTTTGATRPTDAQLYSERYYLEIADGSEEYFSHYPLIARNAADSTIYPDAAQEHYEFLCRAVKVFAMTFSKGGDSTIGQLRSLLDSGPAGSSVWKVRGIKPPPTEDQFSSIIRSRGTGEVVRIYEEFKKSQPDLRFFREATMNAVGYGFLRRGQTRDALEMFRINAETYSTSANTWDSYGDAAMAAHDTALVRMCAQKVLEVAPDDPAINDQFREILGTNARNRINDLTQAADSAATEQ